MKRIAVLALLLASPALAQTAPQPFVPYTVTKEAHDWLEKQLGEIPAKWSLPILSALGQLEAQAQKQAADEAKKSEAAPK